MSQHERYSPIGEEKFPDELLPDTIDFAALADNVRITPFNSLDWGATPLDAYHDQILSRQQTNVRKKLEQRARFVPPEVGEIPEEVRAYVAQNFLTRFNGRTLANRDNFSRRIHTDPSEFTADEEMVLHKAMWGHATPAELLYLRCKLGMGSIELGCITHPYGTHTANVEEMRDSVRAAMRMFMVDDEPTEEEDLEWTFAVKQADNLLDSQNQSMYLRSAFVVTRKRDFGVLLDGSKVRERTSFVVRIDDESEFDQAVANNMRRVPLMRNNDAMRHLTIAGKLDKVLPPFIKEKRFGTVIPLSTTIYAFNRQTEARIETRDKEIEQELAMQRAPERARIAAILEASPEEAGYSPRVIGSGAIEAVRHDSY